MGVRNEINVQEYVSNAGYVIFIKLCIEYRSYQRIWL